MLLHRWSNRFLLLSWSLYSYRLLKRHESNCFVVTLLYKILTNDYVIYDLQSLPVVFINTEAGLMVMKPDSDISTYFP